jgi:RNA polymerase sigma-70 factor (ECF subfamily)
MPLTEIDEQRLERCLQRKPGAWEDFVDRFLGLVIHVINHTAQARSIGLTPEDRDDLCAEVMLHLIKNDFAVLRHFRRESSLATYLTVVARRVVVRQLLRHRPAAAFEAALMRRAGIRCEPAQEGPGRRIQQGEEAAWLLERLRDNEAQAVRMYYLEEKSYEEISRSLGISENSVGPLLSRARNRMRRAGVRPSHSTDPSSRDSRIGNASPEAPNFTDIWVNAPV